MTPDIAEARTPETESPENPEMNRYKMLLLMKHEQTVHGGDCDDYDPSAADKGDQVVVYCDSCGVVLHRKERETDE